MTDDTSKARVVATAIGIFNIEVGSADGRRGEGRVITATRQVVASMKDYRLGPSIGSQCYDSAGNGAQLQPEFVGKMLDIKIELKEAVTAKVSLAVRTLPANTESDRQEVVISQGSTMTEIQSTGGLFMIFRNCSPFSISGNLWVYLQ